ncbi:MAG: GUN4 N-terminal ARM-like repeat domain-containing protein [Microcoleaceae cyanobacterium]
MTDVIQSSKPDSPTDLADLRSQLNSDIEKNQLHVVQSLAQLGEGGWQELMQFLQNNLQKSFQDNSASLVLGRVYQALSQVDAPHVTEFLQNYCPDGVVQLQSEAQVDYSKLQNLLTQSDFRAADKLTLEKLCELAGGSALDRGWIYFSEVKQFPTGDLQTIDRLWRVYSEGRFGYSVQRRLWLSVGKNWEKLWPKINWRKDGAWTRYPQEFTWDLTAPQGHLPLSNQLRGVRVMEALLNHPAWSES